MIALKRERTAAAIPAKYRGAKKKKADKELLFARRRQLIGLAEKIEFTDEYWKKAKVQLKKETNGKCAYCEADAAVVAHGDVEHYRPKSVYWWLAYTYDNYLYACQVCNQIHKKDEFPPGGNLYPAPPVKKDTTDEEIERMAGNISPDPVAVDLNYTLQKYLTEHRAEGAHLLNPYFDNPAGCFAYEADDITREVKMVAARPEFEKHVQAAQTLFGINRIELKNARYKVFAHFRVFKKAYLAITDEGLKKEVKSQIDTMLADNYIFAGMNRYFDGKL
jgi:uncharacterized protein (TIGR02646 family)